MQIIRILGAAALFLLTTLNLMYQSLHTNEVPAGQRLRVVLFILLDLISAAVLTSFVFLQFRLFWGVLSAVALACAYRAAGTHALTKAGIFLFKFACLSGGCSALLAGLLGWSLHDVAFHLETRFWCCAAAMGAQLLLARLLDRVHGSEHFSFLYNHPRQLGYVQIIAAILFLFRLVFISSFSYDYNALWLKAFVLTENMVLLVCYYITLSQTIRYSVWLDQEVRIRLLEEQLGRQQLHYQGYQRYVDQFRQFRSEYEELVGEVRDCIWGDSAKRALTLLDDVEARAEGVGTPRKRYSNHHMVDTILQDTALACEELGVCFEAGVYLPEWNGLTDLDLCRMFNNLTKNALEACARLPQGYPARIVFSSGVFGPWLTITEENTFDGVLRLEDGHLKTTKGDDAIHGLGLSSIKSILESRGGFFRVSASREEGIFKISLHLCRP